MWFKNLLLYRFSQPFELNAEALNEALSQHAAHPCGRHELTSYGWVEPLGRHGSQLIHATNSNLMICARKEEKVIPAAVVRDLTEEKVIAIEESEGRKVRAKEKRAMRDEIMHDMINQAFTRSSQTYAYIDAKGDWLIVDASSPKRAEELLVLLRKSVGSLPVVPAATQQSPAVVTTRWLQQGGAELPFELGDECELREPGEDGGVVRCRKLDLTGDEVQTHLNNGRMAVKLAVEWNERLSCILTEELAVKRLKFLDIVEEEAQLEDIDDYATRFDTDFSIMALELSRFIPALMKTLGGVTPTE
ncbi:recombination-associated protein RdgC [Solemya pervernicosa gill symbiont]|uniref:Recombination-associated protein RdgC n=1 Tax=Solemya pervernicosa gill symbiont TaxID=642797 RepID=A0A1T2L7G8_9GAMM|nr:recombination-associated protein RdgC [Solemya pervernicosa gill symbiont]OOZ41031.1 recombination-associated protein RdgC [Solemya pervernicosa gill symbiont]